MAATFGKYPSLDKQWRKMMFSFYPYLSTKNRNATQEEWKIRRLIWDFKDGKAFANVAHLVANKLIQLYGKETNNIIFACVPASSAEKNEKRYKHFSSMVCQLCGMYKNYKIDGQTISKQALKTGLNDKKNSTAYVHEFMPINKATYTVESMNISGRIKSLIIRLFSGQRFSLTSVRQGKPFEELPPFRFVSYASFLSSVFQATYAYGSRHLRNILLLRLYARP